MQLNNDDSLEKNHRFKVSTWYISSNHVKTSAIITASYHHYINCNNFTRCSCLNEWSDSFKSFMMNGAFVRLHVEIADAGHDKASSSILLEDDAASSVLLHRLFFFLLRLQSDVVETICLICFRFCHLGKLPSPELYPSKFVRTSQMDWSCTAAAERRRGYVSYSASL